MYTLIVSDMAEGGNRENFPDRNEVFRGIGRGCPPRPNHLVPTFRYSWSFLFFIFLYVQIEMIRLFESEYGYELCYSET